MEQARLLRPPSARAADEPGASDGPAARPRGQASPSWRPRLAAGLLSVAALGAVARLGHPGSGGGPSGAPVRSAKRADVARVAMADEEAASHEHAAHAGEPKAPVDLEAAPPALPRILALGEEDWRRVVQQMRREVHDAEDAWSDKLHRRRRGGGAAEVEPITVMTDGAVVEPITVVTDGAPEQQGPGCSEAGEDCSKTRCCSAEGHQCYEKDESWASCMPVCSKRSGWSCAELGERAPLASPGSCSAPGESCLLTRCCAEAGMQCYLMDEDAHWGSCAYGCKPGVAWAENWTCEELGERAPDPLGCSWSGEACTVNQLCCHEGQRCVRKNDIEAYCTHKNASELEDGWDGEVIGGSRYEFAVAPVAPEEARGTSLYCFMAVFPGSPEEQLKDYIIEKKASILACDAHTIFSSQPAEFTSDGTWASVVNTDSFKFVWGEVKQDGQYQWYDWTVKVDPDSVFFPGRLRQHLHNLSAPKNMPIYIKNVPMGFGFFGAIEIFSKEAVDKLFWDGTLEKCEKEVGNYSGEDGYIKGCMDMIGAGFMEDVGILRTPSTDNCTDPDRVCFHAFKDPESWDECFHQAVGW